MKPFEVEIFDQSLNFIDHTLVETPKFSEDYLDPENNTVDIQSAVTVQENYYIRISRSSEEYFGVIKTIKEKGDFNSITYLPFMNFFDRDIMLDCDRLTGNLEDLLSALMTETFISNADTEQNIPGLAVTTSSATASWELGIEPDQDDDHYAEVNLFDDLILPAFQGYLIDILFTPDVMAKTINAVIGINTSATITIEADLPNVLDRTITIKKTKKEINKDSIWNSKDYSSHVTYYLHGAGSFDTDSTTDRMTPVIESIDTVSTDNVTKIKENIIKALEKDTSYIKSHNDDSPLEDDTKTTLAADAVEINQYLSLGLLINADGYVTTSDSTVITDTTFITDAITTYSTSAELDTEAARQASEAFLTKASAKAAANFAKNKYENLIEIEVMNDDSLLAPADMRTGQKVSVIHDGTSYSSIYTGKKISTNTTLIFGLIRLELTKKLKGRA